jgi:archaemetzincin
MLHSEKDGTLVESSNRCATRIVTSALGARKETVLERPIIAVTSVGGGLEERVRFELQRVLASAFDAEIVTVPGISLPPLAYDPIRRQYHSIPILRQLALVKPPDAERLLGVADVDLYVPELNFVFGEADADRGVAVFSLARLHADGARERARTLFLRRAATEAVHELGHTYGLDHCTSSRCVMWFSNTLAESDRKGLAFCADHASQLARIRSHA